MNEITAESQKVKRKACRRFNNPEHAHALTFSCFRQQPFLLRDRTRGWVIDAIDRARSRHPLDLWAYVIMPEHVHLLIYPTADDYNVSAVLTTFKQSVAKRAISYVRFHAPEYLPKMEDRQPNGKCSTRFWQRGGGYDRNLWSPRYIWETIDYIHDNPVRRGLCESPEDWVWSSARAYHGISGGHLKIDVDSLPADPRGRGR